MLAVKKLTKRFKLSIPEIVLSEMITVGDFFPSGDTWSDTKKPADMCICVPIYPSSTGKMPGQAQMDGYVDGPSGPSGQMTREKMRRSDGSCSGDGQMWIVRRGMIATQISRQADIPDTKETSDLGLKSAAS